MRIRSRRRASSALTAGLALSTVLLVASACSSSSPKTGSGAGGTSSTPQITLQAASYHSPTSAFGKAITWWINALESQTQGKVKVNMAWNGSLLSETEMKDGVESGRAKIGFLSEPYTPSAFPLARIVEVPFVTTNQIAQSQALNQLYVDDTAFREEWTGQNLHMLSFVAAPPLVTGAAQRITDLSWFKNKKIRAAGGLTQVLSALGASPQPIPITSTYQAMQRGTIDAYSAVTLDLIPNLSLQEVGKYILDMGLGGPASLTLVMNQNTWTGLPSNVQGIVTQLDNEFPSHVATELLTADDAACAAIKKVGGSVSVFSADQTAQLKGLVGTKPYQDWVQQVGSKTDPQKLWNEYTALIKTYEAKNASAKSGTARCAEQLGQK